MVYGAPLIPLDRSLYDSSSDGTPDPRDARHQYRYRTHTRYLTRRASLRSYMVTGVVGYFPELEEVGDCFIFFRIFSRSSAAIRQRI